MQFIINQISAKVRKVTHRGRKYLVAPAVAVREKVLNGEFLPVEEIAAFVEAWNGIPLVIDHPKEDDQEISANSPDIHHIGRFWHAEMDGAKLKGEMWFDLAALKEAGDVGKLIKEKLEQGKLIELSTAYFRDLEGKPGVHNGERYSGIQRNLRPDHLAVLPNDVGACSIKDGCGVPRTNSKNGGTKPMENKKLKFLAEFAKVLGFSVNAEEGDEEGELDVTFEELVEPEEETPSEKKPEEKASEEEPTPATNANADDAQNAGLQKQIKEMAAQIGELTETVKALASNHKTTEDLEKGRLVSGLAANKLCPLSEKELKDIPLDVLKTLGKSYQVNDYSGRGLFNPPVANEDQIAIPAPVLFAKPEKEKKEA